jgi:hypothetical protein
VNLSESEVKAIMSIAAKIIKHQEDVKLKKDVDKVIRKSEDQHDL